MNVYKCEYCGKLFERYPSAAKKSKGCFCSLECAYRARYKEYKVSDAEYNQYYKSCYKILKKLSLAYPLYQDEMLQVARITLWKCIDRKNKGMIKHKFSTYLYKAVQTDIIMYFNREIKNKVYKIYENEMLEDNELNYHFEAKDELLDVKLDSLKKLHLVLTEFPKMSIACRIVIEKEILNRDDNFLMNKYSLDSRKLAWNLYNGKRQLRNNFIIKQGLAA